jgi:hypothetical protein
MKSSHTARRSVSLAAATASVLISGAATAATVFNDGFESGSLANWTGKSFGAHSAVIVVDPLNNANHAITFNTLESAGELFSTQLFEFTDADTFEVSFDYLGLAKPGSVAGNLGGFVGFSKGTPGSHSWMYGTSAVSGAAPDLIDDGAWRTFTFVVDGATAFGGNATGFHLMFEDFVGSGGVAGDAFFDNITVNAVPSPGAGILAASGFAMVTRRRRRAG